MARDLRGSSEKAEQRRTISRIYVRVSYTAQIRVDESSASDGLEMNTIANPQETLNCLGDPFKGNRSTAFGGAVQSFLVGSVPTSSHMRDTHHTPGINFAWCFMRRSGVATTQVWRRAPM